jgi:hypothetical protein
MPFNFNLIIILIFNQLIDLYHLIIAKHTIQYFIHFHQIIRFKSNFDNWSVINYIIHIYYLRIYFFIIFNCYSHYCLNNFIVIFRLYHFINY